MALDVYVGSLTRYYAGDWQSVADTTEPRGRGTRSDRRAGLRVPVIRARSTVERIRQAVLAWREGLGRALQPHLTEPLTGPRRPMRRGSPAGRAGTASARWCCGRPMPSSRRCAGRAPCRRNGTTTRRWCAATPTGFRSRYSHLVRNVELWLPMAFDFTFEGEDVDGRRIIVGSSTTLARQLGELNAATWKMDAGELVVSHGPAAARSLEAVGRHALAVMSRLVQQAVEHRLPMKLDY